MKNSASIPVMIELCDFAYMSRCFGLAHTHDRYGTSGHDKGKVVERVVSCEHHSGFVMSEEIPLFMLHQFPVNNDHLLPEE